MEYEPTLEMGPTLDVADLNTSNVAASSVWGRLISANPRHPNIDLINPGFVIGRLPSCDLSIPSSRIISSQHVRIYLSSNGEPHVEDLKSSNGTYIDGRLLPKGHHAVLSSGTEISLSVVSAEQASSSTREEVRNGFHSYVFKDLRHRNQDPHDDPLRRKYDIVGDFLGRGAFSTVWKVVERSTGKHFACKIVDKDAFRLNEKALLTLQQEVAILKDLHHPNIIELIESMETPSKLYLVLELIEGGELFDYITSQGVLPEPEARSVIGQICLGLKYLHEERGIAHRDMKLENVLLSGKDPDHVVVKISDFGLARIIPNNRFATTMCGTPQYLAPEVITGSDLTNQKPAYSHSCDLWSMGVMLFTILHGEYPFQGETDAELLHNIRNCNYNLSGQWVSESARNLIQNLLVVNPQGRLDVSGVLAHHWMSEGDWKPLSFGSFGSQIKDSMAMQE